MVTIILILQTSENFNKFDTAQFIVASLSMFPVYSSSGTSRYAKMLTARYCHNRLYHLQSSKSNVKRGNTERVVIKFLKMFQVIGNMFCVENDLYETYC